MPFFLILCYDYDVDTTKNIDIINIHQKYFDLREEISVNFSSSFA